MHDDRWGFVPSHQGDTVLPPSPLFSRLLRFAHEKPPQTVIRDAVTGIEATHLQLLSDVLALRKRLQNHLGLREVQRGEEVYIAVLAAGGYEYAVAMLAVLALGAAVVPLTTALPPDEGVYYVRKSRAVALLASAKALRIGIEIEMLIKNADAKSLFTCMPIAPSTQTEQLEASSIRVSSDARPDENAPAVVIFTSGSTGPPKGAVMPRSYVFDCALSVADFYKLTSSDVSLHVLPVHHATGVGIMFFPFLVAGGCIEFRSGSFDAKWIWERWRAGGLSFFSGVPTIYMRMMHYYRQHIEGKPDMKDYVQGARSIKTFLCGTSALPTTIADFWAKILEKDVLLRYGGSEFGAVLCAREDDNSVPEGSVGEVFPGVDLKLSLGQEGEILVRSPYLFSKYLFDEQATRIAHDQDGFYKTGDIARREGKYFWILGRESIDIIKTGGYKVSALDIERELMGLDYVNECMVVGVDDNEFGQRVAAAIVLNTAQAAEIGAIVSTPSLSLCKLRNDLSRKLARYKLPTIMRLVEGELPKVGTGKVSKKKLGPIMFPMDYRSEKSIQFWNSGLVYNSPKAHL